MHSALASCTDLRVLTACTHRTSKNCWRRGPGARRRAWARGQGSALGVHARSGIARVAAHSPAHAADAGPALHARNDGNDEHGAAELARCWQGALGRLARCWQAQAISVPPCKRCHRRPKSVRRRRALRCCMGARAVERRLRGHSGRQGAAARVSNTGENGVG